MKEKSRKQELTGREVARKIAKESARGLDKEGQTVVNNAVKQSERELDKGGEIPNELADDYRAPVTKLMCCQVLRCKDSRMIDH